MQRNLRAESKAFVERILNETIDDQPQHDAPPSEGWPHGWPKWAIKELAEIGVCIDHKGEAYNKSADTLSRRISGAEADNDQLRDSLYRLSNEAAGMLGYGGQALRDLVGNTNYAVLESKINDARVVLKITEPDKISVT